MSANQQILYAVNDDQQRQAKVIYRLLPVRLQQAREALMMHFRPIFQESNLSDAQWRVLRVLCSIEQLDTATLAARALLLGPSLSRILRDLEQRRLIAKAISAEDNRRSMHRVTPAGRKLVAQTAPMLDPVFRKVEEGLTLSEARLLTQLLDKLLVSLVDL